MYRSDRGPDLTRSQSADVGQDAPLMCVVCGCAVSPEVYYEVADRPPFPLLWVDGGKTHVAWGAGAAQRLDNNLLLPRTRYALSNTHVSV